jgi:sulfotransferase family protein
MMNFDQLIFIVSQPRSGSSLLQQLLLSTKKIKSDPEPWMMLPLIYTFKETNNQQGYNPNYAYINMMRYLRNNNKIKLLKNEIKKLTIKLYGIDKMDGNYIYYLDKTPRYYHIINELQELFPDSKIIILLRNPISVFASILDYNFNGDIFKMFSSNDRIHDLYTAPRIFADLKSKKTKNILFVKYEEIINDPSIELGRVNDFLNLRYQFKNDISYNVSEEFFKSNAIDRKSVLKHDSIQKEYTDSWRKVINTRLKKDILESYLMSLGRNIIEKLGYDYSTLLSDVKNHKVKFNLSIDYSYVYPGNIGLRGVDYYKNKLILQLNKLIFND